MGDVHILSFEGLYWFRQGSWRWRSYP